MNPRALLIAAMLLAGACARAMPVKGILLATVPELRWSHQDQAYVSRDNQTLTVRCDDNGQTLGVLYKCRDAPSDQHLNHYSAAFDRLIDTAIPQWRGAGEALRHIGCAMAPNQTVGFTHGTLDITIISTPKTIYIGISEQTVPAAGSHLQRP